MVRLLLTKDINWQFFIILSCGEPSITKRLEDACREQVSKPKTSHFQRRRLNVETEYKK